MSKRKREIPTAPIDAGISSVLEKVFLQYQHASSDKFYELQRIECTVITRYGKSTEYNKVNILIYMH